MIHNKLGHSGTSGAALRSGVPDSHPESSGMDTMANSSPTTPDTTRPPNRTRDHLANERTFLAWVRTALGLIGLGFVLARMGLFLRQLTVVSEPTSNRVLHGGHEFLFTGVVFLLIGTAICGMAAWLYEISRVAIDADRYEPARREVLGLTILVVTGGLVIAGLVIWQLFVQ